jgi:hypothetical protein
MVVALSASSAREKRCKTPAEHDACKLRALSQSLGNHPQHDSEYESGHQIQQPGCLA